jgi:hypothetical protein
MAYGIEGYMAWDFFIHARIAREGLGPVERIVDLAHWHFESTLLASRLDDHSIIHLMIPEKRMLCRVGIEIWRIVNDSCTCIHSGVWQAYLHHFVDTKWCTGFLNFYFGATSLRRLFLTIIRNCSPESSTCFS